MKRRINSLVSRASSSYSTFKHTSYCTMVKSEVKNIFESSSSRMNNESINRASPTYLHKKWFDAFYSTGTVHSSKEQLLFDTTSKYTQRMFSVPAGTKIRKDQVGRPTSRTYLLMNSSRMVSYYCILSYFIFQIRSI